MLLYFHILKKFFIISKMFVGPIKFFRVVVSNFYSGVTSANGETFYRGWVRTTVIPYLLSSPSVVKLGLTKAYDRFVKGWLRTKFIMIWSMIATAGLEVRNRLESIQNLFVVRPKNYYLDSGNALHTHLTKYIDTVPESTFWAAYNFLIMIFSLIIFIFLLRRIILPLYRLWRDLRITFREARAVARTELVAYEEEQKSIELRNNLRTLIGFDGNKTIEIARKDVEAAVLAFLESPQFSKKIGDLLTSEKVTKQLVTNILAHIEGKSVPNKAKK